DALTAADALPAIGSAPNIVRSNETPADVPAAPLAAPIDMASGPPSGIGSDVNLGFGGLLGGMRQHPLLYFAAGIVLVAALWTASGYLLGNRDTQQAVADNSLLGLDRAVARLTRTLDAQWGVGEINEGAFLRNNQRLELVSGLAEITYKN